jgi:hypothetical protein
MQRGRFSNMLLITCKNNKLEQLLSHEDYHLSRLTISKQFITNQYIQGGNMKQLFFIVTTIEIITAILLSGCSGIYLKESFNMGKDGFSGKLEIEEKL